MLPSQSHRGRPHNPSSQPLRCHHCCYFLFHVYSQRRHFGSHHSLPTTPNKAFFDAIPVSSPHSVHPLTPHSLVCIRFPLFLQLAKPVLTLVCSVPSYRHSQCFPTPNPTTYMSCSFLGLFLKEIPQPTPTYSRGFLLDPTLDTSTHFHKEILY